jgi:hypothetical protein
MATIPRNEVPPDYERNPQDPDAARFEKVRALEAKKGEARMKKLEAALNAQKPGILSKTLGYAKTAVKGALVAALLVVGARFAAPFIEDKLGKFTFERVGKIFKSFGPSGRGLTSPDAPTSPYESDAGGMGGRKFKV